MTARRCPVCSVDAPPAARFCGRCGAVLPTADHHGQHPGATPATAAVHGGPPTGAATWAPPSARDRRTGPSPDDRPGSRTTAVDTGPGGTSRRRTLVVAAAVLALLVAAVTVTVDGEDAIVVGDGLTLPSGPGPDGEPEEQWSTELSLTEPVAPVLVGETILVGGRSSGAAGLIAVDRSSGRRLWAEPLGSGLTLDAVLASDGDVVTVASDGSSTAVERLEQRTGDRVWSQRLVVARGPARTATALPDGRTLVELAPDDGDAGRAVLVDRDGRTLLDRPADAVAASSRGVVVLDEGTVHSVDLDGTEVGEIDVGDDATAVALVGELVAVADDRRVRGLDRRSGEERWTVEAEVRVVALVPSSTGVGIVTTRTHTGVDLEGTVTWHGRGYPLPQIRDGDPVTALVAFGSSTTVDVTLLDAAGGELEATGARTGDYVALARDAVLTADGARLVGTPFSDGAAAAWAVETAGEIAWTVVDGPNLVVVSRDGGGLTLSSWR